MKLRKRILPRATSDWISFIFLLSVIPLFYWFSMFVILPEMYSHNIPLLIVHFISGTFLMFNLTSNFVATILTDTSIINVIIPSHNRISNYFCDTCQSVIPPRCWHCNICNVCILKRDHHCSFAGCCIGHLNHRYFIMFLLYFFIGSCYSSYLCFLYAWRYASFTALTIIKVICPVLFYAFGIDRSVDYCLVILLILSFVGAVITGILSFYHVNMIIHGIITHEKNYNKRGVNLGLKYNIITVFGKKWFLTWLSPFVKSDLIQDGVTWNENIVLFEKNIKTL